MTLLDDHPSTFDDKHSLLDNPAIADKPKQHTPSCPSFKYSGTLGSQFPQLSSPQYYIHFLQTDPSLTHTINDHVGCVAMIEGKSMQPTLNPNTEGRKKREWVIVSKVGASKYKYNRGDVVMLR